MEHGLTEEQLKFPIWLVADSYPSDLASRLNGPLDPRHPTRHTIWTPIWDQIQETVYPRRVNGQNLFICNAAEKQETGEPIKDFDDDTLLKRIELFSGYLENYRPSIVLCFGAWSYEFALRASGSGAINRSDRYWTVRKLAEAFKITNEQFQTGQTNIFPLLHQSVALSWEHANANFVLNPNGNNYFKYVGQALGRLLITHSDSFSSIWQPLTVA